MNSISLKRIRNADKEYLIEKLTEIEKENIEMKKIIRGSIQVIGNELSRLRRFW